MKKNIFIYIFILILLISCKYKFLFDVNPGDSEILIDDKSVLNKSLYFSKSRIVNAKIKRRGYLQYQSVHRKRSPFGIKKINVDLKPETYKIEIKTIDSACSMLLDAEKTSKLPCNLELNFGIYNMTLLCKGYPDQQIRVESKRDSMLLFRHQKHLIDIKQIGIFDCGFLPKQVVFSPDSKYLYIILLAGNGFEIFDIDNLNIIKTIIIPGKNKGFVEGFFLKEKGTFLISQMTTGKVYEYSYPENKYIRTLDSKGIWSKFIAWSPVLQVIAVSNWISNDVSIIEYSTGKLIRKIKTAPAPRGLVFSNDGRYLYVTSFNGGKIQKFNTTNWKEEKFIFKKNGAMRHIVKTKDCSKIYVSNMYHNEIYEISTDNFKIENTFKVFDNPNTIALSSDDKYLYVSCRGKNDQESYLKRSLNNGKITVIDLDKNKMHYYFEGGNQPTGLGLSDDGNYLCFSNFRDNNIEIYWIGK